MRFLLFCIMPLAAKNILIAGGAGFIGANISREFLKQGHSIIIVDNLQTGRFENVESLIDNQSCRFINHDIINPLNISEHIDWIINLACPASPPAYQKDPIHTLKTCILGSINLLELAREKSAVILQASTSEVYGDPLEHPQREGYWGHVNPIGPRSCYDEGKRIAETLFFEYHHMHGVTIKIIRIFNTYGPHMDPKDGRVVSNFIMQALQNIPITIYGDGSQTRSFCFVDDLVRGIIAMMESSPEIIGPINLGNPSEFTMKELADLIGELTKQPLKIVFKDLPQDDPTKRRPDVSRAKNLLNWEPAISLKDGIVRTINYFKEYCTD